MNGMLLDVQNLTVRFGGVAALTDVGLAVRTGTAHGLIGPNGAGKTTLLNAITRLVRPTSGSIVFDGHDLGGVAPHDIARLGISRTFQNLGLVASLSVLENVMVGVHARHQGGLLDELLLIPRRIRREREARARAWAALELAGLTGIADQPAAGLPYGTRKAVELARACAAAPKLLLLDEPTAGLNRLEMDQLRDTLGTLRRATGVTVLVITHHVEFLLGVADEVTVLDLGRRIAFGEPSLVKTDPKVIEAYIGTEE